jgi:drug/metabolite transporter (DMT)-like permease
MDLLRHRTPSAPGWLGILLVVAGCVLAPLESLRGFTVARYWNRTMLWILTMALATAGYTAVDKLAAEALPPGPLMAARYGVLEFLFSVPYYWLMLVLLRVPIREEMGLAHWKWPTIASLFVLSAYWLVLWAYQLSPYASYIVALRQFSIVIGVALGVFLFREPAPGLRLSAALMIALGVVCIAVAR